MLKIYVGDVHPDCEVDVDVSEIWADMLPKELVREVNEFISDIDNDDTISFRVYTDTLINWIGDEIEQSNIDYKQVKVYTTSGEHFYDEKGALDSSWPYGIFNYSSTD